MWIKIFILYINGHEKKYTLVEQGALIHLLHGAKFYDLELQGKLQTQQLTKEVTKHSTHESSVLKEVRCPVYAMS